MYKKILLAIFGIFAVLSVAQLTIADSPSPNTGSETLDTIIVKSEDTFKGIHQGFLDLAGVKTDAQFKKKVEDAVRTFGETLVDKLKAFKEETKSQTGKVADYYREFSEKINNDIEKFKATHPDFTARSKEFAEGVERRYQLVIDEAKNLQNKIKSENGQMSDKAKQLLDDIVNGTIDNAKSLKQQLESGVNKKN